MYNNGDKGKAVEYSQANKYVIKQKSHNQQKNLSEEKNIKQEYRQSRYNKMKENAKLKIICFYSITHE